jgi:hypothetical protein
MIKRILILTTASLLLVAGATAADAATKKHKIKFTVDTHVLRTANGVTTLTGTADGKLGHGAVVITSKPAGDHFEFTAQGLFPNGSITASGTNTAAQNPDGTLAITGKMTVKSGTGTFKGAKGSATVSGTTTKEDPARALYTLAGTLTY